MAIDLTELSECDVLLHVGFHKTATTFLQKKVFPNLELNFVNLSYADGELDKFLYQDLFSFDANHWKSIFANKFHKSQLNLISEEKLSGQPLIGYLNNSVVLQKLKAVFPHATILIVLRRQSDLLVSMYKQYVKEGGWLNSNTYFSLENNAINANYNIYNDRLNFEVYKFAEFIRAYQAAFGRENVDVIFYEELFSSPVLANAMSRFGIKFSIADFDSEERVNTAFNERQLWVATRLNRFLSSQLNPNSLIPTFRIPGIGTINVPKLKRIMQTKKTKWFQNSPHFQFPEDLKQEIHNYFRDDNLELQELIGRMLPAGYLPR